MRTELIIAITIALVLFVSLTHAKTKEILYNKSKKQGNIINYMAKKTHQYRVPGFINKFIDILEINKDKNDLLPHKTFAKEETPDILHPAYDFKKVRASDDTKEKCMQLAREACAIDTMTRKDCYLGELNDYYGPITRNHQLLGSYEQKTNNQMSHVPCDCKNRDSTDTCANLGTDRCIRKKYFECL
jgi:hypothetical protein